MSNLRRPRKPHAVPVRPASTPPPTFAFTGTVTTTQVVAITADEARLIGNLAHALKRLMEHVPPREPATAVLPRDITYRNACDMLAAIQPLLARLRDAATGDALPGTGNATPAGAPEAGST